MQRKELHWLTTIWLRPCGFSTATQAILCHPIIWSRKDQMSLRPNRSNFCGSGSEVVTSVRHAILRVETDMSRLRKIRRRLLMGAGLVFLFAGLALAILHLSAVRRL